MATFDARIDTRRFQKAMDTAPKRLARELGRGMKQHALAFDSHMKRTVFGTGPGGKLWRTGKLARSMGSVGPRETSSIAGLRMIVFIGQGIAGRYARSHEYGATITPRKGRYLTVPLPDNLTAAGVPRYKSARALFDDRSKNAFTHFSSSGRGAIGLELAGGKILWLWALVRKVVLKPQLGFRREFRGRAMRLDRIQRVNAAVRRALRAAPGGTT